MKSITIAGSLRENTGKVSSKQLRHIGHVPCVLYGGKEHLHFSAEERAFKNLVFTPDAHTVQLNISGKEYAAVTKEIQYHPVKDNILHIDFYEINPAKSVKMGIPIKLVGTPTGVKDKGGMLLKKSRNLMVSGMQADLPEYIEINVEQLDINESIMVKDIKKDKLSFLDMPNTVIASVKGKRAEEVKAVVAAAATPAAGAAASAVAPAGTPAAAGAAATATDKKAEKKTEKKK